MMIFHSGLTGSRRRSVSGPPEAAELVIGCFIDFQGRRHAWGDLLFENNCSIREGLFSHLLSISLSDSVMVPIRVPCRQYSSHAMPLTSV